MPFDGTAPMRREQPDRPARGGHAPTVIILVIAFALLALPISMAALVDIVRYVRGP